MIVSQISSEYILDITIDNTNRAPIFIQNTKTDLTAIFTQYGTSNIFELPETFDQDGD